MIHPIHNHHDDHVWSIQSIIPMTITHAVWNGHKWACTMLICSYEGLFMSSFSAMTHVTKPMRCSCLALHWKQTLIATMLFLFCPRSPWSDGLKAEPTPWFRLRMGDMLSPWLPPTPGCRIWTVPCVVAVYYDGPWGFTLFQWTLQHQPPPSSPPHTVKWNQRLNVTKRSPAAFRAEWNVHHLHHVNQNQEPVLSVLWITNYTFTCNLIT